jgi:hypothetical protein
MKSRYRISFVDGSTEEREAESATEAKLAAKRDRLNEIDPGRTMNPAADRDGHPRVQVTKVEEVTG